MDFFQFQIKPVEFVFLYKMCYVNMFCLFHHNQASASELFSVAEYEECI